MGKGRKIALKTARKYFIFSAPNHAMKNFLLPTLFLLCSYLQAQTPPIEKINKQIEKSVATQPDSAKIYMFRLLKHASELHDTTVAKTYSNIGHTI